MSTLIEPLLTDRLILRRLVADDLGFMIELNTDPAVLRYSQRAIPSTEEVRDGLRDAIAEYDVDPAPGRLIAFRRDDGRFAGRFSLLSHPEARTLSLGYRLLLEFWGLGLATEGARALIAYGFTVLGAEEIRAQTMFVNVGSRRVMEKSGMYHTRTFHPHFDDPLPGTEFGEVEYSLKRTEWLDVQSQGAAGR